MISRMPAWLKNKYIIATLAFAVWIIFFDRNDLITQTGYIAQLNTLRDQKDFLQSQILKTQSDLHDLEANPLKMEKFAREKYLMKKDNEDVFLIDSTAASQKK